MPSIPCDIALIPSKTLSERAISVSENLKSQGGIFVLSNTQYYPHISLYMLQLKTADISRIKKELIAIGKKLDPLRLQPTHYHQEGGYIDVEYKKSPALSQLQSDVIRATNPIRDGMREKDKARLLTVQGQVKENIKLYGYRSVGSLFEPHITFTRFENEGTIGLDGLPDLGEFEGEFEKIGLFEMGENGTCKRNVFEIELVK